jgi:phage gp46-like protein
MTDIRVVQIKTTFELTLDWLMTDMGMLDETQELATAVIVALGTDRLARVDDILPDLDSTDRRGWWGDLDAEVIWDGWPIGTRCWLLTRTKIVGPGSIEGSTVARAKAFVREALQPFVERRIASAVDVEAARTARDRIDVAAIIYRGPLPAVELRFQVMWEDQAKEASMPPIPALLPPPVPPPLYPFEDLLYPWSLTITRPVLGKPVMTHS